ncbi:MAG: baseplate J/gp47 family protein [Gallionella sp.]|nr:baseplate J/gp47 family protein [Gallionella sp.]
MAFNRPTLTELVNRILAGIRSRLSTDELRRSDAEVYARELAGASHGLHGHIDFIAQQILPDTAEAEYLDRLASLWLDQARKAAAAAVGSVSLSGISGTLCPAGSVLVRADGAEYTTDADVSIAGGVATVAVTASVAGVEGNDIAGTGLTFSTPIAGINSSATVTAGALTGGADTESDAALAARISARMKEAPHGGASSDYVNWALEVAGVTRAWVYPQELGIGTVTVRFVRDDDASIIPDAGEVATVQAYIDALRPVTAQLTVVAPVAVPLDFTIAVTPNTAAVKAAVEAELTDLLRREAEPSGTILLSHIREAVSIAAGETNYTMTAPAADVTHTTGQMATMGTITWA